MGTGFGWAVYLAYDLDIPSESLVSLVICSQSASIPVILGCDANALHDLWGSSDTNNRGEEYFVDFTLTYSLSIWNVIKKIREEVIDVTLSSISVHARITNWSAQCFSGHRYISLSVSPPKCYLRKLKLDQYIRKANWKKFQNILSYIAPKLNLKNSSSCRDLEIVKQCKNYEIRLILVRP